MSCSASNFWMATNYRRDDSQTIWKVLKQVRMFKGVDNRIYSEVRSLCPRLKTKSQIWTEEIKNPCPSWERFRGTSWMMLLARSGQDGEIAKTLMPTTWKRTAKRLATFANRKPAFLKPTLDGTTVFEVYWILCSYSIHHCKLRIW